MRVLLTGGGTAGHINPALAIAEIIRRHDPEAVIEFVGIQTGKEADLVPREGYRLHFVKSMGIRRSLSPANFKAVWLAVRSPKAKETQKILNELQPDLVIGTGGFASWPIMKAAADRNIPTAIHESNAIPGLTVKVLQKHVDRIWINFPETKANLRAKKKTVCVGNPLRAGFSGGSYEDARRELGLQHGQKMLLSFGGSLGAEAVNRATLDLMESFTAKHPEIVHVHAAGKRGFESVKADFEKRGLSQYPNCRVVDYIYRMPLYMSAADVVIARAGAMTLSELAQLKKACILIPSPNVVDNHQYKNAKALADRGAACLVEEKTLADNRLQTAVEELFASDAARKTMQDAICAFAAPDVEMRIWEEIQALLNQGN